MSKETISQMDVALGVISGVLGNIDETLREGLSNEWEYDEELILDIARACYSWTERVIKKGG